MDNDKPIHIPREVLDSVPISHKSIQAVLLAVLAYLDRLDELYDMNKAQPFMQSYKDSNDKIRACVAPLVITP